MCVPGFQMCSKGRTRDFGVRCQVFLYRVVGQGFPVTVWTIKKDLLQLTGCLIQGQDHSLNAGLGCFTDVIL